MGVNYTFFYSFSDNKLSIVGRDVKIRENMGLINVKVAETPLESISHVALIWSFTKCTLYIK